MEQWFLILVLSWIGLGVLTLGFLWFVNAPYGKQNRPGWGPGVPNQLAWFIMEIVVLVVFYITFIVMSADWSAPTIVFALLLTAHYLNRGLIYPWRTRTKGKTLPLSIFGASIGFNTMNGFLLGWEFALYTERDASWFLDWRFIVGMILFIVGMGINTHSDNILLSLRKGSDTGYYIPRGGMFRWVSSPNLLGEIIEWAGYALLTFTWSGLAFFVWTCANLIPRARANDKWYRAKFADYPVDRKVLIPGVW